MCRYIIGRLNFTFKLRDQKDKAGQPKKDWKRGTMKLGISRQVVHCLKMLTGRMMWRPAVILKTNISETVGIKAWLVQVQDKMKTGRWYSKSSKATSFKKVVVKGNREIEMWVSGMILFKMDRFPTMFACY